MSISNIEKAKVAKNEKFWLGFRTVRITAIHDDGRCWIVDEEGDAFIVWPDVLERKAKLKQAEVKLKGK